MQTFLIVAGVLAAGILLFFMVGSESRGSDERTAVPSMPVDSAPRPDTRPNRPEGGVEV